MKLRTVSPSKLKILDRCPRWQQDETRRDEGMAEAAEEGTRLHALCEDMVNQFTADRWDEEAPALCGSDAPLVLDALEPVRDDILANGLRKHDPATCGTSMKGRYVSEAVLVSPLMGRMKLDWFAVSLDGFTAWVVDFKFVRAEPDVRQQLEGYALTVMEQHPDVRNVILRAPAPKVFAENYLSTVSRADMPRIRAEVERIAAKATDAFAPGVPCEFCCTCSGNGRCPWQAAALRDIVTDPSMDLLTKTDLLDPATPEIRGRRKRLVKWLGSLVDAMKDQDKQWALANPDAVLPGWTIKMCAGRKSLDKMRWLEAQKLIESLLGIRGNELLECCEPDLGKVAELLELREGITDKQAKAKVAKALDGLMVRGAPYPTFTEAVQNKQLTEGGQ